MSENATYPLISIIIAVYNSEKTLRRCLNSILDQKYSRWEIIVIDGNSVDGTVKILEQYDRDITYWVSENDKGIFDAWNKALKHCSGDWIYFLGADDYLWDESVFNIIAPVLKRNSDKNIIYGKVNAVDKDHNIIKSYGKPWNETKEKFLKRMAIPHQGVFHHNSIFEDRTFDCELQYAADYDLLLPEVMSEPPIFVDITIAGFSMGGVSSSHMHSLKMINEMYEVRKKNGFDIAPNKWEKIKAVLRYNMALLIGDHYTSKAINFFKNNGHAN